MKLGARWALPVYPVSEAQSHGKSVKIKKNIAGPVLKYNSKNWMKNLDLLYMNSRSIQRCQSKHKQNHLKKLRNKQSNKLNKYIILDKTWKLLPQRQNLTPLKIPFPKILSKPKFVSEIGAVLYLQGLKKFIDPWRSINSKIFKN